MRFVLLVRIISFRAPAIPFGQLFNEHATINDSTPVPAWLVAHREDAGGQSRCGKKDCVFPPLIHVSPPAGRG